MVCIKCLTQGLAHGMYSTNVNYHEYHYEPQPLTVWITTNWKILKETGIPNHLTCLLRNLYSGQEATVRNFHGTDWFKIGKGGDKAVYCHFAYLTYTQNTSCKMPSWMSYKLESRLQGKIPTTSDMQMIPL